MFSWQKKSEAKYFFYFPDVIVLYTIMQEIFKISIKANKSASAPISISFASQSHDRRVMMFLH
jgi:hypothetical protein